MIVGVTGTAGPFDRMVKLLSEYSERHPGEEIWVQHGPAVLPGNLSGSPFVRHADLRRRMEAADVVVCQAGSGTLIDALSLGHLPVVVPRRKDFGEIVNDHQLELVHALCEAGRAVHADNLCDLESGIGLARAGRHEPGELGGQRLRQALARDGSELVKPRGRPSFRWKLMRAMTWRFEPVVEQSAGPVPRKFGGR